MLNSNFKGRKILIFVRVSISIVFWLIAVTGLHHVCAWPILLTLVIFLSLPLVAWRLRNERILVICALTGFLIMMISLWSLKPETNRDWAVEFSVLPKVDISDQLVTITGFREFRWVNAQTFDPVWEKRSFNLGNLESLDLIIEPFKDSDYLAHTMLRFGFKEEGFLIVSVEARREKHETYSLVAGAFRQFELIYLFGSEDDLLALRAVQRGARLYIYPIKGERKFIVDLFKDLASSANALHFKPKFYRSIWDNCTTTLVKHFDHLQNNHIGLRRETLFPALTGKLLYQMGYMDTNLPYEKAKEHFRADERIRMLYK